MDFNVILMLIIFALCAVGLLSLSKKQDNKKDELPLPGPEDGPGLKGDSGPKSDPEPESEGETGAGPQVPPKPEPLPGPPVISIYSCEAKRGVKICRYCDGENDKDARTCQICRQDF